MIFQAQFEEAGTPGTGVDSTDHFGEGSEPPNFNVSHRFSEGGDNQKPCTHRPSILFYIFSFDICTRETPYAEAGIRYDLVDGLGGCVESVVTMCVLTNAARYYVPMTIIGVSLSTGISLRAATISSRPR